MTMKQLCVFGIYLTFLVIVSSVQGNGALSGDDIEEQARALLTRYKKGDPGVYYKLKITSDDRIIPVYLDALKDPDNRVKRLALSQLSRHRFRNLVTIKPIANLLETAPDSDIRAAAASSLGRFRSSESTRYLIKALHDDSARVVRTAIRALRSIKSEESIDPLIQKLDDVTKKDWEIRLAAAEALTFITGKDWIQDRVEIPSRFRVRDEQITFEAYKRAVGYFNELEGKVTSAIRTGDLYAAEGLYRECNNHGVVIEGFHLKQHLKLQKETFDRDLLAQKLGEMTQDEVAKAKESFDHAQKRYDRFLAVNAWFE